MGRRCSCQRSGFIKGAPIGPTCFQKYTMADITLRLIWYKLGESSSKMAEAAATWYSKLRWEDHFLDILLIGWFCWCSVIVIVINSFVSFVGPLQRRLPSETLRAKEVGAKPALPKGPGIETCQWFNTALNWFYLHYYHSADFLDEWIKSLNEQMTKLGGPVQTKFERIQAGSLPPKFGDISCEAAPEDKFVIHVRVDSKDLAFVIFCSQQTHEGVKLTNCTATVFRLRGTLKVQSYREAGDVKVNVAFDGRPDIKVNVKPTNPYQDPSDMVDIGVVEELVRQAICMTTTTYTITHLLAPDTRTQSKRHSDHDRSSGQGQAPNMSQGYSQMPQMNEGNYERRMPQTHGGAPIQSMHVQSTQLQSSPKRHAAPQPPVAAVPSPPKSEALFVPIEASQYQSAFQTPVSSAADVPPKPPRSSADKRLLVKVIKANGVGAKEIGPLNFLGSVNPVVLLLMDDPIQNHSTSVVRNASNPFWDESFLFDVTQHSNELRFEVFDKNKQPGEDFLGETTVYMNDLRLCPSSRQILALQSRPGNMDSISGSLTVEFLFMDSAEAEMMMGMPGAPNSQLSPKRRIETERTITPGGTVITTTTTTTHRPQFGQLQPGPEGHPPSLVEKHHHSNPDLDSSSTLSADSPYFPGDQSLSASASSELIVINGVESVTDAAIRELKDQSRRPRTPTKTSTLIITGVKRTIESSPTDEGGDITITSATPEKAVEKEKKKSSFGEAIRKRFGRKKRSQSADRAASSLKEGANYLRPPEQTYGPQSKDDMELVRSQDPSKSPNLKKSRSLGGSLKKLFRRSRKRSKSRGESSRDSSFSRSSDRRGGSQNPSRDSSLNRHSAHQRAASTS
ncbi:C2 domain-containing protein 2-like isoform X3 [Haliotis asinina]|uniref:C2 domain-containing protein 2-like isoform X3 n=1 Tax=Haliotis asinina TaxID=109174 RepID=UPI003531C62F